MAALVYKEGNLTRNPKVTNFFKIFNNFDYNNNNKLIFIKKVDLNPEIVAITLQNIE